MGFFVLIDGLKTQDLEPRVFGNSHRLARSFLSLTIYAVATGIVLSSALSLHGLFLFDLTAKNMV